MDSTTPLNRSINQHTLNQHQLRLEIDEQHRLGFLNWLPLIIVVLPNLAPIFFDGEPESWRRSIIFLLIVFFLYKISKAPWQLYASARTTRIFHQLGLTPSTKIVYPTQNHSHQDSLTELNRIEIGFLLLAMSSPAIGIALLVYLQTNLDLGLDYLNPHSSVLFLLASLVKPLGHLHDLVLQRSRYLQSQLEFPTQSAEQFNDLFESLAFRLNQLEIDSLTRSELISFKKNHIDSKLLQISNRLSQFQKSDQIFQSDSFDRLSNLEIDLTETREKLEKAELSFNHLLLLNHHHSSPLGSISKVVTQILNPHDQSEKKHSTKTSKGIVKKASRRIEQSFTPINIKNNTTLPDQLISDLLLFKINPGLETVRYGLEIIGHQILNGIKRPITTTMKLLSCSFTFFLTLCLILNPIQILRVMTTKKTNYPVQKYTQPIIKTSNSIKRTKGGGTRENQRHSRTLSMTCPSSPPSSATSDSSSEHQSPPLRSPPVSSHANFDAKLSPQLSYIDSSDPHSLYHLHD